ncbi:alpha/beta fold hydrolase [Hoyosella altamirensis]|uniref:Pimeloyl-ACP methyl ester carboxylesterase n=1 Tax=Hoyosella altamirensis TaxID=616997 RepID=A0A839RJR5_9ACTN|nr:alpha/beta hydrolase [Hoyosella altamirensis]MBB3036366.1 pimeloyl-ACP methyl ester carboxylesterase [Hoyosella altamirensis]
MLDVESRDGTRLAVWREGTGPPLVMVHGSLCDHTRFDPLISLLKDHLTVYAMDRRGFGASGDGPHYSMEREFEDVAAVVDAVSARESEHVTLWGHSYGANCAMGGCTLTENVTGLILYEPSFGLAYPRGSVAAVEKALASGDRQAAIRLVAVEVLEMTEAEVRAMRDSPLWPKRLAAAPTVPRECRAEEDWVYRSGQFDRVTAKTLILTGTETPAAVRVTTARAAAALPDTQVRALEGHGHFAFQTDPSLVASIIKDFAGETSSR